MADLNTISQQFVDFYYQTFSKNRGGLEQLYRDSSTLTWENDPHVGKDNILEKLKTLPFLRVQHKITTQDAQISSASGSIIVLVTGLLLVDDGENPLQFSQTFQLIPEGSTYYIQNDLFRLNYG